MNDNVTEVGFDVSCGKCSGLGQIAFGQAQTAGGVAQHLIVIRCQRCGYMIATDGKGGPWKELKIND